MKIKRLGHLTARDGGNLGDKAPRFYRCDVCGREDYWGKSWQWYGSDADFENDGRESIAVACSEKCGVVIEVTSHKNTRSGAAVLRLLRGASAGRSAEANTVSRDTARVAIPSAAKPEPTPPSAPLGSTPSLSSTALPEHKGGVEG